jgi:hypothetical protein
MTLSNVTTAMNSAFARLKWSVFEDLSTIRVAPEEEEDSGAEFKPFIGHPLAAEAATEVPLHEIRFSIMALDEFEGGDDDDQDLEAPDAVVVRGKDGNIVTIEDVVEQLSPHFNAHKREILEVKAPFVNVSPADISMDTKVFFDQFFGIITPGLSALGIELWIEGEDGESIEEHFR